MGIATSSEIIPEMHPFNALSAPLDVRSVFPYIISPMLKLNL